LKVHINEARRFDTGVPHARPKRSKRGCSIKKKLQGHKELSLVQTIANTSELTHKSIIATGVAIIPLPPIDHNITIFWYSLLFYYHNTLLIGLPPVLTISVHL